MNTDSIFLMGKTHKVCQDYAYSNDRYLIVSDGCSSSPNTDIGARILTQCAKTILNEVKDRINYEDFGTLVISKAQVIVDALRLNKNCLDATLIVAFFESNRGNPYMQIFMYGDGVIIFKEKEKTSIQNIRFSSGAPYYLSYQFDYRRQMQYLVEYDKPLYINEEESDYSKHLNFFYKIIPGITQSIIIGSDGLSTFLDMDNSKDLDLEGVIHNLTDFKTTKGEFLKRRVIKATKSMEKINSYHMDDIALAGAIF